MATVHPSRPRPAPATLQDLLCLRALDGETALGGGQINSCERMGRKGVSSCGASWLAEPFEKACERFTRGEHEPIMIRDVTLLDSVEYGEYYLQWLKEQQVRLHSILKQFSGHGYFRYLDRRY